MMKAAILIPAYNATATLKQTLDSIMNQAADGLANISRVVVADDGSSDGTVELARASWSLASPPLEVWQAARNQGERKTCNDAFRRLAAEGIEWCYVLHADDVAKPHWISSIQPLTEAADARLTSVCSSWDNWHEDDTIEPGEDNPDRAVDVVEGNGLNAGNTLRMGCWWHFSGCAMHLPRFFEAGAFDEAMPQLGDLDWVIRCLLSGHSIAYLPRTLIKYRAHAGSVSTASFRMNRDFSESRRIHEKFRDDERLAVPLRKFLQIRSAQSLRRCLGHAAHGRILPAFRTFRWVAYFGASWCKECLRRPGLSHR